MMIILIVLEEGVQFKLNILKIRRLHTGSKEWLNGVDVVAREISEISGL